MRWPRPVVQGVCPHPVPAGTGCLSVFGGGLRPAFGCVRSALGDGFLLAVCVRRWASAGVRVRVFGGREWVLARGLAFHFGGSVCTRAGRSTRGWALGRFRRASPRSRVALCRRIAGLDRSVSFEELVWIGAKWQPPILEIGQTRCWFAVNALHRDVLHLVFNLSFPFNVGRTVEKSQRFQDYPFIIVVSAVRTAPKTGVSPLFGAGEGRSAGSRMRPCEDIDRGMRLGYPRVGAMEKVVRIR